MGETRYLKLSEKIIAYKTTESWRTVPHVSFIYQVDLSKVLLAKQNVSVNTLLLKIIVEAIKAAPQINSHIKYNAKYATGKIETFSNIDISMPMLLENGEMVTVNLRNFENKSLTEMQNYIDNIKAKIKNCNIQIPLRQVAINNLKSDLRRGRIIKVSRVILGTLFGKNRTPKCSKQERQKYNALPTDKKITAHDLDVGTITISNIGSLYKNLRGFVGLLEIIPPQVFAIGIGSIQKDKTISMCFAFDHRALNFSDIVPFIQKIDVITLE